MGTIDKIKAIKRLPLKKEIIALIKAKHFDSLGNIFFNAFFFMKKGNGRNAMKLAWKSLTPTMRRKCEL